MSKKGFKRFVDIDRPVQAIYYDLIEKLDSFDNLRKDKELRKLMMKDPDFLDSYLVLYELFIHLGKYEEAASLLDRAFGNALRLIVDQNGTWPDELMWGYLENRHIIRTLFTKAVTLWEKNENVLSLSIFRHLLRMNLNDNVGAREYNIIDQIRGNS
ncbi:hypothetical protein LEP1GSC107_3188 [Leptospira interrogans serovar Grippotyphosa str. UI 12769]|uniref:tetratricopeptide repeat protein n=1 Tax=Leptospira TaxID=171 RepID=UPI0002927234|nr:MULTISPECIES: tetratricopeptide repeat protein [Leptospira]AJR14784.1 hypothetical protein LIL_12182 [Leptospira interrogans serovar Linhai str. 56609]EKO88267.1 hypothetical protein LEP1GSC009_1652 [Leptospira interrogans serovar Grippotyphosa str. Andaman]EKP87357.1 hypothetical protein LEP1GSC020_3829 [Leptospira interrogans serovar Grippotyphosa str. 2006006986]EKR46920.1 hypothetical protein LEP1GSC097_2811 [Leptospira interrogans serovar Grippotyphosa str. UI 08368]EMN66094.1 hypothet